MDKNNFSDLYSASRKDLYKYCRTLCGNDADDLMQQTYLKAWENFGSFRGENFSFWLRSIARNIFLDNLRKSRYSAEELPEISDNSNNPEFIAEKRDIGRILLKALKDSLSPVQRMTIILYYYDEKSVSEIANIMQVSENTVKSRLFNARKKLREELKRFGNIFTCLSLSFAVMKHKLKNIQISVNARITVSAVLTAASMALISVSYSPPENKFPDTVIKINETYTSENLTTTENKTDIQTSSETASIERISHATTKSVYYTMPTVESHTTAFKSEYEEIQDIIPEESEEGDTEKELTEENDIQTEYEEDTTMKKEIIAVTTTAVTAFSGISTMNVRAVDKTESTETTVSEIASSLGADTDYFNFVNYVSNSVKADYIAEFNKNCSDIDNYRGVMPQMTKIAASGHCYGMAVLQVLVHNGIIKPSDIQEGAETIHDIQFNDDVNGIVSYYAATQLYQEKELSDGYYFCNSDYEKQAKDLIEYAEKAMQEDKYFVINLSGTKFGHAVVGIGCTDGEWTFNDKIYNKCILTLDSNLQEKDGDGNTVAGGFAENTCIYINTNDYNFYIPAYNLGSEDESLYIRGIYDDENFLNYKGCINPSYELEKDISDLTAIEIDNFTLSDYSLTVDGKTYNGTGEEPLDITVNDILTNQFIKSMRKYFVSTADNIRFSIDKMPENANTSTTQLYVTNTDSYSTLYAEGKFDVDFSENRIETNHEGNIALELVSEKSPYNADWQGEPFNMFLINMTSDFMQNTGTKTAVEINENGFLLSTNGQTDAIITLGNRLETEGGWLDYYRTGLEGKHMFRIICNNDIMFKYNNNSDSFDIFIDDDNDNIFDKKIEQGDIDCNGQADAADASLLLKSYAEFSVKNYPPIYNFSSELADLDDDGAINAADASLVLQKYAKSATE